VATHGTVLHEILPERYDDVFTARVASIGAFVVHVRDSNSPQTDVEWLLGLMFGNGD